ncbi:MAG: GNAT family N-acetyltransferase [Spirochaetaceae bacterium]|nr:GNAT family N-acetyltransferase [Spirochaetaceae bacterium]
MIELKEVTKENFEEVIALNAGDEGKFVAGNLYSMAEAKVYHEATPLAIYNNEVLVGFLMHEIDSDNNNHYICRLMVDKKYQAKGYGKQAMEVIIKKLQEDKSRNKIVISAEPDNSVAIKLYEKLGFKLTGEKVDGEDVLELIY